VAPGIAKAPLMPAARRERSEARLKEGVLSTGPDGVVKLLDVEGNVACESRAAGGLRREHCGSVARLVAPSTAQAKEPRQARRVRIEHISSWSANRSTSTASQSIVHTCRKTAFFAPMHVLLRVRAVEAYEDAA
jgi:hypothetical protein